MNFYRYSGEIVMIKKQIQYGLIAAGVLLLLLVLIFTTTGSNSVLFSSESIQISSKQVQRSVNSSFPLSHSNAQINITLRNPKVVLKDGWEHVAIKLDLNLAMKKRRANRNIYQSAYNGKVTLSGTLKYLPKSGNILLNKIKLRILNSKNIKAADIAKIEKSLVPMLQSELNKHPIYRLKGKQFKHKLNEMALSNIQINKNTINLELALK